MFNLSSEWVFYLKSRMRYAKPIAACKYCLRLPVNNVEIETRRLQRFCVKNVNLDFNSLMCTNFEISKATQNSWMDRWKLNKISSCKVLYGAFGILEVAEDESWVDEINAGETLTKMAEIYLESIRALVFLIDEKLFTLYNLQGQVPRDVMGYINKIWESRQGNSTSARAGAL